MVALVSGDQLPAQLRLRSVNGPAMAMASRPPTGWSLADDLEEEDGLQLVDGADEIPAVEAHVPDGSTHSEEPPPARSPLARYLAGLDHTNEATTAEEDLKAEDEPTSSIDDAPGSADGPTVGTEADHSSEQVASSWPVILHVGLEVAAPLLIATLAPQRALAHRAKRWCIRVCDEAARVPTAAEVGSRGDQLHQQHAHIAMQLRQLRRIYLIAMGLAALQLLFFAMQLGVRLLQHLHLALVVSVLLGFVSVPEPTEATTVATHWLPFFLGIMCAVSTWNSWIAYSSFRRCLDYHSFTSSFIGCLSLLGRSESSSKKLILLLMEREIVRRGYQIAQYLPPIERIEQQQAAAWSTSADSSARLRVTLQQSLDQEAAAMQSMEEQFQEISLTLFSGFSSRISLSPVEAPAARAVSSPLPSIVELKNQRSSWLDVRARMLRSLLALLQQLDQTGDAATDLQLPPFLTAHRPTSLPSATAEHHLSTAFLRLSILLTRRASSVESFLPSSSSDSGNDGATPAPTLRSTQGTPLVPLPTDSRRSVQQSLMDVNHAIRSAQQRVQIALERQQPPQEQISCTPTSDAPSPVVLPTAASIWQELLASVSLPPLHSISTPATALAAEAASAPWTAPLSTSFATDVAYVRQILKQLHRHCDTLEQHLRRTNADEGVEDESPDGTRMTPPELTMLAQTPVTGGDVDADATVTPADLLAAMAAMRKKTPEGMGALFEGSGQYEVPDFRPRRSAPRANGAAPAGPVVSIFTILAELKCVLEQRKPTYEYFTHTPADAPTEEQAQ